MARRSRCRQTKWPACRVAPAEVWSSTLTESKWWTYSTLRLFTPSWKTTRPTTTRRSYSTRSITSLTSSAACTISKRCELGNRVAVGLILSLDHCQNVTVSIFNLLSQGVHWSFWSNRWEFKDGVAGRPEWDGARAQGRRCPCYETEDTGNYTKKLRTDVSCSSFPVSPAWTIGLCTRRWKHYCLVFGKFWCHK